MFMYSCCSHEKFVQHGFAQHAVVTAPKPCIGQGVTVFSNMSLMLSASTVTMYTACEIKHKQCFQHGY